MSADRKFLIATAGIAALTLASCSSSIAPPPDPGEGQQSDPTSAPDLRTNTDDILLSLAGYELELLSEEIGLMADTIATTAVSSTTLSATSIDIEVQSSMQSFPISNVLYDCSLGGTLTISSMKEQVTGPMYVNDLMMNTYRFEQCQIDAGNEQTITGNLQVSSKAEFGNRFTANENRLEWSSFERLLPDDTVQNITATIDIKKLNTQDFDDTRNVAIGEYTISSDGTVSSGLRNASFRLRDSSSAAGGIFEYSLDTAGEYIHTSGTRVTVLAEPTIYRKFTSPGVGEESVPFSGQITFTSNDGSTLLMVANGLDDTGTTRVADITYTDATGTTYTTTSQAFIELEVDRP